MLDVSKDVTLNGKSKINGVDAEGYTARINSTNPVKVSFNSWVINDDLRKDNRTECRADQAEFEDMAYDLQSELAGDSDSDTTVTSEDETPEV